MLAALNICNYYLHIHISNMSMQNDYVEYACSIENKALIIPKYLSTYHS